MYKKGYILKFVFGRFEDVLSYDIVCGILFDSFHPKSLLFPDSIVDNRLSSGPGLWLLKMERYENLFVSMVMAFEHFSTILRYHEQNPSKYLHVSLFEEGKQKVNRILCWCRLLV